MKFSLWTNHGALNSRPIFDAFATSLRDSGYDVAYNDIHSDVHVIWSVLWYGRMAGNKDVWDRAKQENKKIIVLEVGGIKRGNTWKVGINGINGDANFGAKGNDSTRVDLLGLEAKRWTNDGQHILVCGQHDKSLQWQNMPRMSNWFLNTHDEIRKYTDRPIVFRPHPRCRLDQIERGLRHVYRQEPKHIDNTYDDFDMDFTNVWATVSYSSNPGIHSILEGVPAFVGTSSLAYDVGNDIDFFHDIEAPLQPDRTQWLNDLAYTEWTVEEISAGLPLKRLTSEL